jgi:hypothetical protein
MMRPNRVTEQDLKQQQICANKIRRQKRAPVIAGGRRRAAGLHKLTLGVRHLHRRRLTFAVC